MISAMPASNPRLTALRNGYIATGEANYRSESPSLEAVKDLFPPDQYSEVLSPAEAAFAYDGVNMKDLAQHRLTYNSLPGLQEAPVDSGYSSEPGTNGVTTPTEGRSMAQLYEDQFQRKSRPLPTLRERIKNESPVIAHLRTNVIVKDEFSLVTDLSHHLANRFSRTEAGIMISVDHSQCLMLARSFEPTYILTISAVPSELRAETNKLHAAHIQSFISDILSVPPERGVVRFESIAEENLAMNGTTVLGSMERIHSARPQTKRWPSNTGMSVDPPSSRMSSRRSSFRATERVAIPAPLSSSVIPERSDSIASLVSSLSQTDLHSTGNPLFSNPPRQAVRQASPERPTTSGTIGTITGHMSPRQAATPIRPTTPYMSEQRPMSSRSNRSVPGTPAGADWRPAMPTPPGSFRRATSSYDIKGNAFDMYDDARRDTVLEHVQGGGQRGDDTALPPPPIARSKTPSSIAPTTRSKKRRSLLSIFRNR